MGQPDWAAVAAAGVICGPLIFFPVLASFIWRKGWMRVRDVAVTEPFSCAQQNGR